MSFLSKKIEVRVLVGLIDRRHQILMDKRAGALARGQISAAGHIGDSMIQMAMLKHDLIDLLMTTETTEACDAHQKKSV